MPQYTPNYNLYKPNRLDTTESVDVTLSDNFVKIDTQFKAVDDKFNTIQTINANAELENARGGFANLDTRLDNVDTQLAEKTQQVGVSVKDFGAVGDGTDETIKIQNAVNYAFENEIRDVYFPPPITKYNTTSNLDEKDRTFSFEGDYFTGTWRPQTLVDLSLTEGFPKDEYSIVKSFSQRVKDSTKRWWTTISTIFVPKGFGIGRDHVASGGRAITEQEQSSIWGGLFLVQATAESRPVGDDKNNMPGLYGIEVDVNNHTGLDMDDLTFSEVVAIQVASGGQNQAFAVLQAAKLSHTKGFYVGTFYKDDSIAMAGTMFDDVNTTYGTYYTESYKSGIDGGTVISIPSYDLTGTQRGRTLLEVRNQDGKNFKLRYIGSTSFLDVAGGGLHVTNNNGQNIMATFGDSGEYYVDNLKIKRQHKTLLGLNAGQQSVDALTGCYFFTQNTVLTNLTTIINGMTGQEITFHINDGMTNLVHNSTSGAGLKLQGGVSFRPTVPTVITFIFDGVNWSEKSRSVNG